MHGQEEYPRLLLQSRHLCCDHWPALPVTYDRPAEWCERVRVGHTVGHTVTMLLSRVLNALGCSRWSRAPGPKQIHPNSGTRFSLSLELVMMAQAKIMVNGGSRAAVELSK